MLRTTTRRLLVGGVTLVSAVALAAAPASAHFCFNTKMAERAAQAAAGSSNWVSFHDLAYEFTGLCDAGIDILADAGGVSPDTLIHMNAVMAGGTLREGGKGGTPAISHLDFDAIDAAFGDAIAACA
jgi:hypothetical protein